MRKVCFWLITLAGAPVVALGGVCSIVVVLWRAGWTIGAAWYQQLGED